MQLTVQDLRNKRLTSDQAVQLLVTIIDQNQQILEMNRKLVSMLEDTSETIETIVLSDDATVSDLVNTKG